MVNDLSRSFHSSSKHHLALARRVCRYVAGKNRYALNSWNDFTIAPQSLHDSVDIDWGGC